MIKIKKVIKKYNVYDVKVKDTHNFFVNSILVHNCTEIIENTKPSEYKDGKKSAIGETAVCNLASINLNNHTDEHGNIDWDKLRDTIIVTIRGLDNVIDLNFYPTEEAENSNMKHRPIGLGLMGWHDMLHKKNINYDSDEAVAISDEVMSFISATAIEASCDLATERGSYSTFAGSLWNKGELPIDAFYRRQLLFKNGPDGAFPAYPNLDTLREKIKKGMRNSNVLAIAPTASISYQHGCEQSIEPNLSVLFVYENKSGSYYIINLHFVNDMKKLGLWNRQFAEKVKEVDGDVKFLNIPSEFKEKYKTAFDRNMFKLIDCNASRQKHIDQSVSFNIYNGQNSLKYLSDVYLYAWNSGLKTTYYLRNKAATKVEKSTESTVSVDVTPIVPTDELDKMIPVKMCLINDPTCESCQ